MRLDFDNTLYSEQAVIQGIEAFRDIAEIMLDKQPALFACTLLWAKYEKERTLCEFGNYVLNLTAMRSGGTEE